MTPKYWEDLSTLDRLESLYWIEVLVDCGRLEGNMSDEEILEKCKRMYYCDISMESN